MKNLIYEKHLGFLKESDNWSKEKIENYQLTQLKKLVDHCTRHVPYYAELFQKSGVSASNITSLDDIRKIPLLSKEIINSRHDDFIADKDYIGDRELFVNSTSGSSGVPLKLVGDDAFRQLSLAETIYYMNTVGLDPYNFKCVRLRGEILSPELIDKGVFWTGEGGNKLIMSSAHIKPETVKLFVEKINEYQPDYIHTFPSVITLLSQYIEKYDLKLNIRLKAIFADSERLFDDQREVTERIFKTNVYSVYAQTENVVRSTTCKYSSKVHIMPQAGITELLDDAGNPIKEPGVKGEIIGTGFSNKIMPLIRYRTMDIGVYTEQECGCGRNFLLLERIEGRLRQYLVDSNENIVPMFEYNKFTNIIDKLGIYQYQIFQDSPGKLEFRYIPEPEMKSDMNELSAKLSAEILKRVGRGFTVDIKEVKEIKKTKNGKYLFLVQTLDTSKFV